LGASPNQLLTCSPLEMTLVAVVDAFDLVPHDEHRELTWDGSLDSTVALSSWTEDLPDKRPVEDLCFFFGVMSFEVDNAECLV